MRTPAELLQALGSKRVQKFHVTQQTFQIETFNQKNVNNPHILVFGVSKIEEPVGPEQCAIAGHAWDLRTSRSHL